MPDLPVPGAGLRLCRVVDAGRRPTAIGLRTLRARVVSLLRQGLAPRALQRARNHDMDEASATTRISRDAGVRRCERARGAGRGVATRSAGVGRCERCDKTKCRCGYQFCYQCGTKDAKCGCTPSHHVFYDNVNERPDGPDFAAFI